MSYGQQRSRDCESTHDRMTNWLYLFLITLASVNLLQYHMRLGGGPRQSHSLGTNGGRGGGFRDKSHSLALRVCMVTNPSPKKNQLFLPKTDRVERYLILKVLIQ